MTIRLQLACWVCLAPVWAGAQLSTDVVARLGYGYNLTRNGPFNALSPMQATFGSSQNLEGGVLVNFPVTERWQGTAGFNLARRQADVRLTDLIFGGTATIRSSHRFFELPIMLGYEIHLGKFFLTPFVGVSLNGTNAQQIAVHLSDVNAQHILRENGTLQTAPPDSARNWAIADTRPTRASDYTPAPMLALRLRLRQLGDNDLWSRVSVWFVYQHHGGYQTSVDLTFQDSPATNPNSRPVENYYYARLSSASVLVGVDVLRVKQKIRPVAPNDGLLY